ncbi:2OG-Fe(II) oxygenase superfamily-domain-containing protein [Rhexocercosporidium sp. MPI-PUGE-AT-0058]|nr:2OG-Fe(II) oxygenase superfamily-domain-containing protein [Rhexocercosporidium sp. MPI-PUGE-AT-0058]
MAPQIPAVHSDEHGLVKFSISEFTSHEIEKIVSGPTHPFTIPQPTVTAPSGPQLLPRKRAAAKSSKGQPKSKKAKTQHEVTDDKQSEHADVVSQRTPQPLPHGKLESFGQPTVWAERRAQLCETLNHFRAHEAGVYQNKKADGKISVAYGLYLDAGVSSRDFFNNDIIITTLGGGKAKNENGDMERVKNHAVEGGNAGAFRMSMKRLQPIVVITGKKNTNCRVELTHYFNVLGYFHVTALWYDKSATCCWMVKLQRCDTTTQPWWSVKGSVHTPLPLSAAPSQFCGFCKVETERIYEEEWICMHPACKSYFKRDGLFIDATNYHYSQPFLEARSEFMGQVPVSAAPCLPDTTAGTLFTDDLFNNYKQGFVCSSCGCCSRQKHWSYWECENKDCGLTFPTRQQAMSLADAQVESAGGPKRLTGFAKPGIKVEHFTLGAYQGTKYSFPDETGDVIGFVALLKSNKEINSQKNGPDELYDLFSSQKHGGFALERKPVRAPGSIGEKLTQQFGLNYGATYKFIVRTESKSFSNAPPAILRVLKRCTWAAEDAVNQHGGVYEAPNELLALGYTECGEMGYHDDGEKTVGSTVTSLSLGCRSTMNFRPKSETTLFGPSRKTGHKPAVLQFSIEHGDLMVMHGSTIQKLYEHCANTYGQRRFALTCRTIRFDTMSKIEKQHAMEDGAIPAYAEEFKYDGDVGLLESGGENSAEQD